MGIIENAIYYQSTTGVRKLSLIAFSGDFDRLTAVFTLATGAAAVGYEVNIFFTGDWMPSSGNRDALLQAGDSCPGYSVS